VQIKADPGNGIFLGTAKTLTAAAAVFITVPSIFKNVQDIMGARLRILLA
jgi:hypothetical protein